ncbi:hypothetical protein ACFPZF_07480, partial [Kitasatospora cinereorecta]
LGGADGEALAAPDGPADGEADGGPDGLCDGAADGTSARSPAPPGRWVSVSCRGAAGRPGLNDVPVPDCPVVMAFSGRPAASSTTTIGAIASTNTSADAIAYDRHVQRRRARSTREVFHSEDSPDSPAGAARDGPGRSGADPRTTALRSCSPVRRNMCWNTAPPVVAPMLTTAAPRTVPYTPSSEASTAPTTAASALAAT